MESEMKNFIVVWVTVMASLYYCHTIAKFIPRGTTRLITLLPIITLFLFLHLKLTSIHFGSITCFFTAWLANFKLLLFAYGQGPLSSSKTISFPHFALISCLPIKIHQDGHQYPSDKKSLNSFQGYTLRLVLMSICVHIYKFKEDLHPKVLMLVYCVHIYVTLELLLGFTSKAARALAQVELDPPFDEPYLSGSLQDFWGRRWNLIVASLLRPTVYDPVLMISSRWMSKRFASILGILATFLVSGLMHEVIVYNIGRTRPTWEVTCFFIIHGVCLVVEGWVRKLLKGKFSLPPVVAGPLVATFVVVTGLWLFIPAFVRCNVDVRVREEIAAAVEFVKENAWFIRM